MKWLSSFLLVFSLPLIINAQDLDFPYQPPTPYGQTTKLPPTDNSEQSDEQGDDPRDTPPPTFFGEDLDIEGDALIYG